MSLTPAQIGALREIETVWPQVKAVIIGATGLGFYYDMRWRQTSDVDLVLALEIEDFPGALLGRDGWSRHKSKEHEFISPQGAKLDLLPVGPGVLEAGQIQWPSGQVMNVVAIDLAFDHAESHSLLDESSVLVAPPQVITLLKMASYCDRPLERERDLQDIAHLLDGYVDEDDERRWAGVPQMDFELAPAYLLGVDVARAIDSSAHRTLITNFLARVTNSDNMAHTIMHDNGPASWRTDDSLTRCLAAFQLGLGDA